MNKFYSIEKEIAQLAYKWKFIAITFSGGKDSTALTFALLNAFEKSEYKPKKVWILYVNTLVEPPPLLQTAQKSLDIFGSLSNQINTSITTKILIPELKDRFWTLLIGKGYPPPSVRFRWCSNRLKIRPVKNYLKKLQNEICEFPLVLSGVRLNEGNQRKKNLSKRIINGKWMRYEGLKDCFVYAPLLDLETSDIWKYIEYNEKKWGINIKYLKDLYSLSTDGVNGFRTGCWVCTLIKKDKSLEKFSETNQEFVHLVEFRKFLLKIRDNKKLRMRVEKNGRSYLGPLNMDTRRKIFDMVNNIAEISAEESKLIHEIWNQNV